MSQASAPLQIVLLSWRQSESFDILDCGAIQISRSFGNSRFIVPLEGQSFLGPFKFDLFIRRGLLVFSDCSVCIT